MSLSPDGSLLGLNMRQGTEEKIRFLTCFATVGCLGDRGDFKEVYCHLKVTHTSAYLLTRGDLNRLDLSVLLLS